MPFVVIAHYVLDEQTSVFRCIATPEPKLQSIGAGHKQACGQTRCELLQRCYTNAAGKAPGTFRTRGGQSELLSAAAEQTLVATAAARHPMNALKDHWDETAHVTRK